MNTTKTIGAPAIAFQSTTLWIALFALATVPLFALQLSLSATLQMVVFLSLAMVALANLSVVNAKHFDAAHLAIKLLSPIQFVLMIWLSVYMGREIAGTSFVPSFVVSTLFLFGVVTLDALASAALALIVGSCRAVTGLPLATLISAKYAGLLGKVE